ncbi:MAG: hypothetical protein LIO91_03700 [Bacteroidales bacterium]|nr:hypothetical protein [Bacteroidales bacterium]
MAQTYQQWLETETGYKSITTFWDDFSIADRFGLSAVKDTFNRAFKEWKDNYKYLTELVIVLNHKLWWHYERGQQLLQLADDNSRQLAAHHDNLGRLYNTLWRRANNYAHTRLKGKEMAYFFNVTD